MPSEGRIVLTNSRGVRSGANKVVHRGDIGYADIPPALLDFVEQRVRRTYPTM